MRLTEALVCALANVLVSAAAVATAHFGRQPVAGTILAAIGAPPLLILNLYFSLRDILGDDPPPGHRRSAWLALSLACIPIGLLLGLARSFAGSWPIPLG